MEATNRPPKRARNAAPKAPAFKPPRKSLSGAGAGIDGEAGARRSTRQRYRPLEFWRNERKVYGREFKSLPTVMGVEVRTPAPMWPASAKKHRAAKHRKVQKVPIAPMRD